jgi:tryptophan halogenase
VIDCSGFKALLMSKILKEPFVSYSKSLLCDRALVLQVPHRDPAALEPCTTATALSAGWSFALPLFHRVGTGYVFSSAFRTDEEAKLEYCRHLGVDPDKVEPRAIAMRVGRSRRAWVGNCVAIGLAGGFIEPLEATAIMATQVSIMHLWRHMPNRSMQKALRHRYNQTIGQIQDQIRDFITMHYFLSNRNDPFWRAARAPEVLSDELGANLEVWRHRLPYAEDLPNADMFTYMSYGVCMTSKGFYRGRNLEMQSNISLTHWRQLGLQLAKIKAGVARLPSLHELLVHLRRTDDEAGQTAVESVMA